MTGKRHDNRPAAARRSANRRGARAERHAALLLRLKGYRVLARRYRAPVGEIDLLANRGRVLVGVEVKSRQTRESAAYSITPRQQQRIARAMEHFLAANPKYAEHQIRFDAILATPGRLPQHIPDAWRIS